MMSSWGNFDKIDSDCEDSGILDEGLDAPQTESVTEIVDEEFGVPQTECVRMSRKSSRNTKSVRHVVNHNYHDHCRAFNHDKILSRSQGESGALGLNSAGSRGGVAVSFPVLLHQMLSSAPQEHFDHIVSWQPHGRCFRVHKPQLFVDLVMPRFFKQSKLTSFQRQLNLYGFSRLTTGPDSRGYYHEMFLRGHVELCEYMVRTRIKGTGVKAAPSPSTEPNFNSMQPCICSANFKANAAADNANWIQSVQQVTPSQSNRISSTARSEKAFEPLPIGFSPSSPQSVVTQLDDLSITDALLRLASRCSTPSLPNFDDSFDEVFEDEQSDNWINNFDPEAKGVRLWSFDGFY